MRTRNLLVFLAGAVLLGVPLLGQAHFLWARLDPTAKTVAIGLQEVPTGDPLPLGARAESVKAWSKSDGSLVLKADGNLLNARSKDDCVGASLDYGVLDLRKAGRGLFWLKYYAKAATTPAASSTMLGLPVELTLALGADGKPVVTVYKDGRPAPGAEVHIDSTPPFDAKTGADGTVVLPNPSGAYAVRALITEQGAGTDDGKAYDLVRSYGTLTVGDAEPLTRRLHEAFGNDHDVVGNTAFIKTLMAGKLTKNQLEDHLQQRALINEAVDKIMRAANPAPYGDDEKNVLKLLRSDLEAMGASWPTGSQAWPLTQAMLKEIQDSAKKGPYFALGVFNVYFGGITHGGRDIGAQINDTLKIKLDYYLKSDGYASYARLVDQITDPKDQAEMIRGGVAAYRYIIAVNDSKTFASTQLVTPR